MQSIRNIAILAHVDAGKTTLSERILFTAGEIGRPGNVEEGLATMDYLPEEKARGITIEAGVAHFEWRNIWFNFIDTPGHIDFGAEVDMALSAVDGAVLVVSAANGVETQTMTAWNKLRAAGVRTLLFINKLDNKDYSLDEVLLDVEERLGVRPLLLSLPEYTKGEMSSVVDVISQTRLKHNEDGREEAVPLNSKKTSSEALKYYKEAVEFASLFDDPILEQALKGENISPKDLIRGLENLAKSDEYVLCYAGSALENFGVRSLMTGLSFFLPSPPSFHKKALGQVVRLRYFRGYGEISLFRSMCNLQSSKWPLGFSFYRMKANMLVPEEVIREGDIYAMKSEEKMELGNYLGKDGKTFTLETEEPIRNKYQPLLQTQIECLKIEDYNHIEESLQILSRMDPSFKLARHHEGGYWILHTVGEVQLDVLLARLKREFHCDVRAGEPEVQWQERLVHKVGPIENSFQVGPHKVSVSLSAEPLLDSESDIRLRADFLEEAPREILAGVRSALLETAEVGFLGKGSLVGVLFEIHSLEYTQDVNISMIKKACSDAVSMLFKKASIVLYEPYMALHLECPVEFAGVVTNDIQSRQGKIKEIAGDGKTHSLEAEVPLKEIFGYSTAVRSISKGTAIYDLHLVGFKKRTC